MSRNYEAFRLAGAKAMQHELRLILAAVITAYWACLADAQDQVFWQPSLEVARQVAAKTDRLVLLHFWSPSCRPCLRLDTEVFSRPEVAKALDANFVLVKLNVDDAPGTARIYGV